MKKALLCIMLASVGSMQPMPKVSLPTSSDIKTHMMCHKNQAIVTLLAALLARPAYNWLMQSCDQDDDQSTYNVGSLVGYQLGEQPKTSEHNEQIRAQVSVGSADLRVKFPKELKNLNLKDVVAKDNVKRSAYNVMSLLKKFYPKLTVAIEDKASPVIRNEEKAMAGKVQRLVADLRCGDFSVRSGVDLSEALMVLPSMVASYVLYNILQYCSDKAHQAGSAV